MDATSFLQLVVPEQGDKLVCEIYGTSSVTGKPTWRNFVTDNHAAMAVAAQMSDTVNFPTYFALAGFAHGVVGEHAGRSSVNARWVRSLWIDIDVEEGNSKKYAKKSEAGQAIEVFARKLGLPDPLIVVSGGGLHVYWPLDKDYPVAEWRPVAQALKVRAVEFGLKFDPTRTADAASVLRPVGTHNRKRDSVRRVDVVDEGGGVVTLSFFANAVQASTPQDDTESPFGAINLPIEALSLVEQISADITNLETRPRSAKKIFESCRQMAIAQRDMQFGSDGVNTKGERGDKVIEPLWVAGITVLNRCEDAIAAVHKFSSPYPGYSQRETEDKRLRFPDSPTTCIRFNELNPGGCTGCRFAGTIKSPIELGIEIVETTVPIFIVKSEAIVPIESGEGTLGGFVTQEMEKEIVLVQPGKPYKRSVDGIYVSEKKPKIDPITNEVVAGEFVYEDECISRHDIFPVYQTDLKNSGYSTFNVKWRVIPAKHPELVRDVLIPRKTLADEQGLLSKLAGDTQFSPIGEKESKAVVRYMRYYMNAFQAAPIQEVVSKFGWENSEPDSTGDLSFVYGRTRIIRRKGEDGAYKIDNEVVLPGIQIEAMADLFKVSGTVAGWAEAAKFYQKNGSYKHILGILCGLGAPFMKFTGERSALVVMRGPGGCGKSKVQDLVAAAWGGAKSHLMMAGDATLVARMIHMGTMHHLPVLAEDIKDMKDEQISHFIMDAANGEERMRGTPKDGGTVLQERRSWCTTTLVSTNIDWRGRLDAAGSNNEGQNRRLLQIDMDPMAHVDASDARVLEKLLAENTGAIGPLLIQQWMEDPEGSQRKLDSLREFLTAELRRVGEERGSNNLKNMNANEMSIMLSSVVTGLWVLYRLRNKMGLVDWDPTQVIAVVCDILEGSIEAVADGRVSAALLLSDFMDESRGKVVFNTPSGITIDIPGMVGMDLAPIRTPIQDVVGRLDSVKGEDVLNLSVAALKKWLRDRSVSYREFLKLLIREGYAPDYGRNVKVALTKGCPGDTKIRSYVVRIANYSNLTKDEDGSNTAA